MPLSRRDRWFAWIGAAALAAALLATMFFAWSRMRDRQIARDAEAEVTRTLQSLSPDHPIARRYGSFLRMEGEGFVRTGHVKGSGWVPIVFTRKVVFSQAHAHLSVLVYPSANIEVETLKMFPAEEEVSGLKPTIFNGELWFPQGTESRRSSLFVRATHPRCPAN